ncbi:acyl-CoA synthetase [Afipia sp. P52-10]|uniref:acetate--CoA ligase family protein n=1 Tax=Afipia sp. P52-10 TaxID=1429916 RepID=UPI0003DF08B7|nr:acetate--CoA ligase family protein [Afipia sp. P52-10]ETR76093.1 acyl-CoA synthetase [Afipia sp. P52-10]
MNEAKPTAAATSDHPLPDDFFWPKSIALIGASPDQHTIRGRLMHFIVKNKFPGKLYPVNPTHKEIEGYKTYPSVTAIGMPVDLAIIVIPAKLVVDVVEECAQAGVRNVMIIASGFAEEGGAASGLQERLAEISNRTGIRIAGPNCEGYFNALADVAATFSPVVENLAKERETVFEIAPDKRVGVVSQSGGLGFALYTRGRAAGLSFSYVISSGNEVDLSTAHYLEYMVGDPHTQIVMLLCETIRDGERFKRAAREAERLGKPIIVIKIGHSDAGARAAASHTASLTGSQTAYHAVFERYGVIEANDLDEAVAIAAVFATCPLPQGRRVGIVTGSGGGGAIAADMLSGFGLQVPALSEAVQRTIRPLIPPHASPQNPVDITAQGGQTGPVMMTCMEILDACDDVDMVLVIVSTARENGVSLIAERMQTVLKRGASPVVIWTYTLPSVIGRKTAAQAGAVLLSDIRLLALALAKLADYAEHRRKLNPEREIGEKPLALPTDLPRALSEHRVKTLFAPYGLSSDGETLVTSAEGAVKAATKLGFPVVLKIQSPDILHKTEIGGVKLHLNDAQAVSMAYGEIVQAAKAHKPDARIEGVLVQKMAPRGHELVIGMVNDATFGPIMMVGFGGVTVELFGDVVHAPAPLSVDEAAALIRRLKSARLLEGFRGTKPVDIKPAAMLVSRLSEAAVANAGRIAEMEFNPVILHADGSGLSVADALVLLKPTG